MIDLILPCLDEAAALPWVLARVPAGVRALVVDNGSTDGSAAIAEDGGARVVHCPVPGYGAACHAGLLAATADLVAFCDCDASVDPGAVLPAAARILTDTTDLVVGRRRPTTAGAWPAHARWANHYLAARVRRRTGAPLFDIGPLRVARRRALLELAQQDRRSGYPLETVLLAARAGWRISAIDIDYRPRAGRSKVTGTVRGTALAVKDMSAVLGRSA